MTASLAPLAAALLVAVLAPAAHADEGMWLPEQLPDNAERLQELGLAIPVEQLADPMGAPLGAIITLGFCSASFISPDGLIATNHHCVSGYLGYNSSADANRARDGYLAADRSEELWAGPGSELQIVESLTDVTDQVMAKVGRKASDKDREARVDRAIKELVAACEEEENRRCRVASYYGGRSYRLIKARELKDVRLVYAPPESVGSYGGEIDNWMWPRHAGDFALLRAYVAPDGSTAEHADDNVPYTPAHYLRIDPTGAQEGELVMVAGYPGGTDRHAMADVLRWHAEVYYPRSLAIAQAALDLLKDEAARDPEAAARLSSPIDGIGNGVKYRQGMLDNFESSGVVARVQARDAAIAAWVAADKKRTRTYGRAIEELRQLHDHTQQRWPSDYLHQRLVRYVDLLGTATTALRLAEEKQKPDLQREQGFQERDEDRIRARAERLERTLWLPADRRLLSDLLDEAAALPADERIAPLDAWVAAQGGRDAALERLFTDPALARTQARLDLLAAPLSQLQASTDPWVELARALETWRAPRRALDKVAEGARLRLEPVYMEALLAASTGPVYPDANSSLRITYGTVRGYKPQDGLLALPHTTVAGMAKKAGDWPFDAPQRLLDAAPTAPDSRWADPQLGDVPVDFLTDLDTTGGNSGSATLNNKGELVGLIFDGNYESMSADWLYDPVLTRSIHVDVRYLLWMLDSVEEGGWLLEELGLAGG